jgi:uncharacterized protein (UPF0216 family)
MNLQDRDKFTDVVLRDEFRRLNSHLPKIRRTLGELLAENSPEVPTVSGHSIRIKKDELELLSRSLPVGARQSVRIPLVLLRRRDMGTGAFTVLGDPYEEYAVSVLAEAFKGTYEEFKIHHKTVTTIYRPQVSMLLRQFHSLLVIGFGAIGMDQ